jgi:hypothetical protein
MALEKTVQLGYFTLTIKRKKIKWFYGGKNPKTIANKQSKETNLLQLSVEKESLRKGNGIW